MKTITFDEKIYKLVSINPTEDRIDEALPGVVEHTWPQFDLIPALEELRFVLQGATPSIDTIHEFGPDGPVEAAWQILHDDILPLFTHPPAQPDTEALKARNVELAERLEWARQDLIKQTEKIDELAAQLAAQAGQEQANIPVMVLAWHAAEQERLDCVVAYNAAFEAAKKHEWPGPCTDREYQAMTAAANKAHALKAPMHEQMKEMIYSVTPPAPASPLHIVQAALEVAAQVPREYEFTFVADRIAKSIRAINPQSILDGMKK